MSECKCGIGDEDVKVINGRRVHIDAATGKVTDLGPVATLEDLDKPAGNLILEG